MYKIAFLNFFILFLVLNFSESFSKGDLTRQKAIEVEVNLKGENWKGSFF